MTPLRILVVDDHPAVRSGLISLLRLERNDVYEAANGTDALALLSVIGVIDLLITDVRMPGDLNGKQLAARALSLQPSLRVLLISASPREELEREAIVGAADFVLRKPFAAGDLRTAVQQVITGRWQARPPGPPATPAARSRSRAAALCPCVARRERSHSSAEDPDELRTGAIQAT